MKQIAKILELSNRTVDNYLEQLRVKFSAQDKYDLITKAISNGFLSIVPESIFRLQLTTNLYTLH
jgi:DNA-binding NarL/FixJ family response regulator